MSVEVWGYHTLRTCYLGEWRGQPCQVDYNLSLGVGGPGFDNPPWLFHAMEIQHWYYIRSYMMCTTSLWYRSWKYPGWLNEYFVPGHCLEIIRWYWVSHQVLYDVYDQLWYRLWNYSGGLNEYFCAGVLFGDHSVSYVPRSHKVWTVLGVFPEQSLHRGVLAAVIESCVMIYIYIYIYIWMHPVALFGVSVDVFPQWSVRLA